MEGAKGSSKMGPVVVTEILRSASPWVAVVVEGGGGGGSLICGCGAACGGCGEDRGSPIGNIERQP